MQLITYILCREGKRSWMHFEPSPIPTRRAILDRLRAGPANAGGLAADFGSSRSAVSPHLKGAREARLVIDERIHTVNPVPLQAVAGGLEGWPFGTPV
jgi:DNA-binding transcriptional ArsR family regulator